MKNILLLCLCMALTSCFQINTDDQLQEALEYAYFEGQRDALEGEVAIKRNQDSCYIWIKSPWEETGRKPIFDPSFNCN